MTAKHQADQRLRLRLLSLAGPLEERWLGRAYVVVADLTTGPVVAWGRQPKEAIRDLARRLGVEGEEGPADEATPGRFADRHDPGRTGRVALAALRAGVLALVRRTGVPVARTTGVSFAAAGLLTFDAAR